MPIRASVSHIVNLTRALKSALYGCARGERWSLMDSFLGGGYAPVACGENDAIGESPAIGARPLAAEYIRQ